MTRIVEDVRRTKLKNGFLGSSIVATAIPYPAVPAEQYIASDKTDLFDSIELGRVMGLTVAQSMREDCPTRFILAGYSQGVIVAREVAQDLPDDAVIGVLGVGDPSQRGGEPGIIGGGAGGDGIYRWLTTGDDSTSPQDSFYEADIKHAMWCHPQDWICNFYDGEDRPPDAFNPLFETYDHSYAEEPVEAFAIAAVITKWASDSVAEQTPDPDDPDDGEPDGVGDGNAVDVVFCIDTTGSMQPYIDEARESAIEIADTLRAKASVVRVAVVEYRDKGDDFRARVALEFTSDAVAFEDALGALDADGGGDTPESVLSGVMLALNQPWDPAAVRSLIVLGDAKAKDPEPGTGFTEASVTAAMRDLDQKPELPPTLGDGTSVIEGTSYSPYDRSAPGSSGESDVVVATAADALASDPSDGIADVSLFAVTADRRLTRQMGSMADSTGGVVASVSDADEVSTQLVTAATLISSVPEAVFSQPSIALAGHPITLAAAGSTALPGSLFSFDADSDGVAETTSAAWAQQVVIDAQGDYTATLTITDPYGRTATDTVTYEVIAESELQSLPEAPETSADDKDDEGFLGLAPRTWLLMAVGAVGGVAIFFLGHFATRSYLRRRKQGRQKGPENVA